MTPPTPRFEGAPRRRGPLVLLLDLFSNVRFGIVLLALLFVYSSVGSAGIFRWTGGNPLDSGNWIHLQLRQIRGLEMTEFEWFHWWPFDLLMGLICANVLVTTLRRIRLNAINAGVWMIHAGILILCAGSFIYFAQKVEGDVPVVLRQVAVQFPTGERTTLPAVPGARRVVPTLDGPWLLRVVSCDSKWLSEDETDPSRAAFAAAIEIDGPRGNFWRRLLDGRPEDAEDLVRSDDPRRPMRRFSEESGRRLVSNDLSMRLEPSVSEWFFLSHWIQKSWALYLREKTSDDSRPWIERPAEGIPLYNDYLTSYDDVWMAPGRTLPLDPIDVPVLPVDPGDPLAGVPLQVTAYLRYARMETRRLPSPGGELRPTCVLRLHDATGEVFEYELDAFDPHENSIEDGLVSFRWATSERQRAEFVQSSEPLLRLHVHSSGVEGHEPMLELPVQAFSLRDSSLAWTPVGDSGYSVRVEFHEDRLQLEPGQTVSMVSLEVRSPEREFRRWVFSDSRYDRDFSPAGDGHGVIPDAPLPRDEKLHVSFQPGRQPSPVTILAGPQPDRLAVVLALPRGAPPREFEAAVGELVSLGGGNTLVVTDLQTHSQEVAKPAPVPPEQRIRDDRARMAMVRVGFRHQGKFYERWVPFHHFPLQSQAENLRRNFYLPTEIELEDGRTLEVILSRQRYRLPNPVRLDEFTLTEHVGGFTGTLQSIRNWTSQVSFLRGGEWSEPVPVSVNAPRESGGLWFFQAEWDPPSPPRFQGDVPSNGLNFTVLGVGNREGVMTQLLGCCLAVLGMIYAFYYKPVLLARRRARGELVSEGGAPPHPEPLAEPALLSSEASP